MKPAYRRLTPHGKFQKSRNVISCVLGKPRAPPTIVKKSRIARYTLQNSAVKFDGRVLFPCAYVTVCDFLDFVEYLFLKLFTRIFPLYGTSNYYTPVDEENHFVSEGDKVTQLDLLTDWPEHDFCWLNLCEIFQTFRFRPIKQLTALHHYPSAFCPLNHGSIRYTKIPNALAE